MIRIQSWNVAGMDLYDHLSVDEVDIALLQEARPPRAVSDVQIIPSTSESWFTAGRSDRSWRTAIVNVSGRFELVEIPTAAIGAATAEDVEVSRHGSLTLASLRENGREVLRIGSAYAAWERPPGERNPLFADASAHRLLSDLAHLLHSPEPVPTLISGDWNLLHGYSEGNAPYWERRYQEFFDRARTIGLEFAGPQHPNGVQARPWPDELPRESRNVPTYARVKGDYTTAARQLDFVFCTPDLLNRTKVRALNSSEEWGPSDHARVLIEIEV